MKRLLVASFVLPALVACASTHPGEEAHSILATDKHLPLKISARTIEGSGEDSFQLIEITAENVGDAWIKISRAEVIINPEMQEQLGVVTGQELVDWAKAMDFRQRKEAHNTQLAMTGLAIGGAALAAAGSHNGNSAMEAAGAAAMVGTFGWAIADSIQNAKNAAEFPRQTPSDHFYTQFTVPGKMFVRKWALVRKPTSRVIDNLVVEVESEKGEKDRYKMTL